MKRKNPTFGCPRIAMQIKNSFGIAIDKDIVRRVLAKYYKPKGNDQGPSWLSFLGCMKDSLWSVDLFRCESILLKTHWVMVVMDQFTRRIIGFAVHDGNLDGTAICCMFNTIIKERLPKYLSSDNDPLFEFSRWKANLRILDIEEVKTIPFVPISHPFVERMIGSIRRELLDKTLFWNSLDLQRKLNQYRSYYNEKRSHQSLDALTPIQRSENFHSNLLNIKKYDWESLCHRLFQLPIAA
jgi:putative transposase